MEAKGRAFLREDMFLVNSLCENLFNKLLFNKLVVTNCNWRKCCSLWKSGVKVVGMERDWWRLTSIFPSTKPCQLAPLSRQKHISRSQQKAGHVHLTTDKHTLLVPLLLRHPGTQVSRGVHINLHQLTNEPRPLPFPCNKDNLLRSHLVASGGRASPPNLLRSSWL